MRAVRIAMLVLSCSLAGACSFNARSDSYRCELPTDCDPGRTCQDGWCVTQVTPLIDAPAAPDGPGNPLIDAAAIDAAIDAPACPAECSSCVGLICVIQCPGAGDCAGVVCPAGWACEVHCDGDSACAAGVDCTAATSCDIACTGPSSCQGAVDCGAGACDVSCTGDSSCTGGIDCASSCSCDTACGGPGSCTTPPSCPGPNRCTMANGMCTSNSGPCNQC